MNPNRKEGPSAPCSLRPASASPASIDVPNTPPAASSHGGHRPGAGAPIGNFNALKHGRRSAQLRQLFIRAAKSKRTRALVGTLAAAALLHKAGLVGKRKRRLGDPVPPGQAPRKESRS